MVLRDVVIQLPEELIQDAEEFQLINSRMIETLVRQELDRRVNDLVNVEIHDYRREKKSRTQPDKPL